MSRPILLIDGLNLFMRHFVVNPTIDESGNHIGGVVGFLKSLGYLVTRVNPSRVVIAWEGGGSSRRRAAASSSPHFSRRTAESAVRGRGRPMPELARSSPLRSYSSPPESGLGSFRNVQTLSSPPTKESQTLSSPAPKAPYQPP